MDTTNEPVAWMQTWENQDGTAYHTVDIDRIGKNDIPLYTHPSEHDLGVAEAIGFDKGYKAATAKTLTDGEIVKIFQKDNLWQYSDLVHETDAIEFARAILRNAQEADKIESLGTVNIGGVHFRNGKEVK